MTAIKRITAAILILIMAVSTPGADRVVASDESDKAPYLYYYSDRLNAFVIERADGTDARVIGRGVTNPPYGGGLYHIEVLQSAFSPSRQWLAWTARQARLWAGESYPYLININGQRQLMDPGFSEPYTSTISWHPEKDQLLIAAKHCVEIDNVRYGELNILLVEPSAGKITSLTNGVERVMDGCVENSLTIDWMSDGTAIVERVIEQLTNERLCRYYIIDPSSALTVKTYEHVLWSSYVSSIERNDSAVELQFTSQVHAAKYIGRSVDDELVIQDVLTGEPVRLQVEVKPFDNYLIWRADRKYALLMSRYDMSHAIDRDRRRATPLKVDQYETLRPVAWTRDGKYLLARTMDVAVEDHRNLYRITLADGSISKLTTAETALTQSWYGDDSYLLEDKAIWGSVKDEQTTIHTYNMLSGKQDRQTIDHLITNNFQISPDSHFLASVSDGTDIIDLRTQARISVSPEQEGYHTTLDGEVEWSRDSEWLITYDDLFQAGGGGYFRSVNVIRRDGRIRRRLTYIQSPDQLATIGWLPTQFDFSGFPDPLPNPIFPLPKYKLNFGKDGYTTALAWSKDSQQLLIENQVLCSEVKGKIYVWGTEQNRLTCEADSGQYVNRATITDFYNEVDAAWSADMWQIVNALPYTTAVTSISPDRQYVAVANGWDVDIYKLSDLITW